MNNIRIIGLLILLLSGSSFSFSIPLSIETFSVESEDGHHLIEDCQDLSYSNLVTPLFLFTKKIPHPGIPLLTFENLRESSRARGYFSNSYLIEPGLGLEDIIFPFHTFL